jgi:outer membrane immunogenic protein
MRKLIFASVCGLLASWPAMAADLPVKAAPYAPPPAAYNWTGFWIGIRGGYGVNSTDVGTLNLGGTSIDIGTAPKGFVGGGDAGLDFQFSPAFVGGIYIEQDFADLRSTANMGVGGISLANLTNYLGAAGARFGYLVTPASLLYLKGGFAWVGAHPNFSAVGTAQSISDTSVGYELGVGLEHKLVGNWSVKIEYDHTHAGDKSLDASGAFQAPPGTVTSTTHYTIDKGMIGIAYKLF